MRLKETERERKGRRREGRVKEGGRVGVRKKGRKEGKETDRQREKKKLKGLNIVFSLLNILFNLNN